MPESPKSPNAPHKKVAENPVIKILGFVMSLAGFVIMVLRIWEWLGTGEWDW